MSRDLPGLLLINLGTPEAPTTAAVRRYLAEFLSDARVLDMPAYKRWLLLHLVILRFRPRHSAQAYAKIWHPQHGSPLLHHSRALQHKVQARLQGRATVELGMRYGQPSIARALGRLREAGASRIVVFALYPQYASATTGSCLEVVLRECAALGNVPSLTVVPPCFDHPAYLDAQAAVIRPHCRPGEPVVFSYHGLPERQARRGGPDCLSRADCCATLGPRNRDCYRAQCLATTALLGERLGVPPQERVVCFQSRLGRAVWISPYTEAELTRLCQAGVTRATIVSPAFVADCLETLEELGLRAVETWRAAGGQELRLAPALNADDGWADAVVTIARDAAPWL